MNEENRALPTLEQIKKIHEDDIPDIVKEVEDAFEMIPFENSSFQTSNFVIAASITPARAYRAIGLRMSSKLRALSEYKYSRLKEEIELEELQEKINDPNTNKFDRRRAELDIAQKLENRRFTEKLVSDAIEELNILYHHFKQLPKYTREQFEQEEEIHFQERLNRQIRGVQGAHESLINMRHDAQALIAFEQEYQNQLLLTGDPEKALLALTNKGETK